MDNKPLIAIILSIFVSIFSVGSLFARSGGSLDGLNVEPQSLSQPEYQVTLRPIFVFKSRSEERKFWRLVKSVKRVYPLAKSAQERMRTLEAELATYDKRRDERSHIRAVYQQLKDEYTPVLRKMTYTDGRVLIRLIDRETEYTAYEVLDEFKGGFTATFWQGVGRLFGHNLKDEYGSHIDDETIERIITYYEAGLL